MPADPNPDNWQKWLGGGLFAGGFIGALLNKIHTKVRGPSDSQMKSFNRRLEDLEYVQKDDMREIRDSMEGLARQMREIRARLP